VDTTGARGGAVAVCRLASADSIHRPLDVVGSLVQSPSWVMMGDGCDGRSEERDGHHLLLFSKKWDLLLRPIL
jgi:hypothetical protein